MCNVSKTNWAFGPLKRTTSLPVPHGKLWLIAPMFLLSVLSAVSAQAQDAQKPQKQDDVIKVKSNLVNIDVMVKDKRGKYISDLKPEDFVIIENGVPQTLKFFDAPLNTALEKAKTDFAVETTPAATTTRNYVSIVLDSQSTDITNLKPVRDGIAKFVREQTTDTDAIALFSIGSGLSLLVPFTQDKTKLLAALDNAGVSAASKNFEQRDIARNIEGLRDQLSTAPSGPTTAITSPAAGSEAARAMIAARMLQQFIQLRTVLGLQQSRPILAALAAICDGLKNIPGKKTLVLFSQGFVTPAALDWQIQSTIDIANRANVAIYIIDSAGLRADAPRSGSLVPSSPLAGVSAITNQEQRIQAVGGENVFDYSRQEGQNRQYDILYRMSGDTGGRFLKGNNDLAQGLERINQEIQARYTLAYSSTNQNFDGTFRKVKVEVRRPDAQVVSRSGYFAIPPEDLVLLSPDEKKLLDTFDTITVKNELPLSLELIPFRSRDGLNTVALSIELPPAAVRFDRNGQKRSMRLQVLGVVRNSPERILSRLGGNFDIDLSDEQYESIISKNIFYRQDVMLTAGDYTIDLIVKDKLSGKISTRREKLEVPEPDSEFAATPVVLSRYVESIRDAGPSAEFDVLTSGNVRIRPSPAHQFHPSDNLILFSNVYNAALSTETGRPLVRVTVRLFKDGQPATKPYDYVLTEISNDPVPHLTLAEYIKLGELSAGSYTVKIQTKDMVTRKLVQQEAAFTIVP
jgi:VWFA-related protein